MLRPKPLFVFSLLAAVGCGGTSSKTTTPHDAAKTARESLAGRPQTPGAPRVARRQSQAELPALLEPPAGSIGTAGPLVLIAASPSMGWASFCQARQDTDGDGRIGVRVGPHGEWEGDQMTPYLTLGTGKGEPIDEFVGHSPGGRYVAYVADGRLLLRDTTSGTETDLSQLGADPRNDQSPFSPHRAASFDPLGRYVAYIRRQGPQSWVILRDMQSGEEVPVDPGHGVLWRAEFEPGGEYLKLSVVTRDTNGNRRLGWTIPPRRPGQSPCPSPLEGYRVASSPGDEADIILYHIESAESFPTKGFVGTSGPQIISRTETGELWKFTPGAGRLKISSEECQGKVMHVDDQSGSVLFGCSQSYAARRRLFIRTARRRKSLDVDLAPFESDGRLPDQPRLVIVNPRVESYLLDVRTGRMLPLPQRTYMLASHNNHVLAHKNDRLRFIDEEAHETTLDVKRPRFGMQLRQGAFVSIGVELLDLARATHRGQFQRPPIALSAGGQGLLPAGDEGLFATGPLRWEHPRKKQR